MKKSAWLLLIVLAFFPPASAHAEERILASVNGEPVTHSDYRRFMLKTSPALDRETVDDKRLEKLIEEKIILQEARRQRVEATDAEVEQSITDFLARNSISPSEFESKIREQGMSPEDYRKWLKDEIILLAKFIDREVDAKVEVKDSEVQDYYRENRKRYLKSPEIQRVQAIFLRTSDAPTPSEITEMKIKILRTYAMLSRGETFEKLVGLYAEDSLKKQGGTLGEFRKGELTPDLDSVIAGLKEGEVSTPVQTGEGVYILKLVKRTAEAFAPFEVASKDIYAELFTQKRDQKFREWTASLWTKASVIKQPK